MGSPLCAESEGTGGSRGANGDATFASPGHTSTELRRLRSRRAALDEHEGALIGTARHLGMTWREIASDLGLGTPQAAWQRAQRIRTRVPEGTGRPPPPVPACPVASSVADKTGRCAVAGVEGADVDGPAERIERSLLGLLQSGETFANLSVGQLLTEAGVARSTFYAYYGDKLAVLLVIGRRALAQVAAHGEGWATLSDTADRSELHEAVSRLAQRYRDHAAVLGALGEATAADPRARAAMRAELHGPRRAVFDHARAQQARGAVRPDVDVDVTVGWIVAMVDVGLYRFIRKAPPDELDAHVEVLTDMIWRSLYEGSPNRGS